MVACDQRAEVSAPPPAPSALAAGPTADRAELCSGANVVGVGLQAEYFAAPGWRGPPVTVRTDAAVDLVTVADLPEPLREQAPGSARWTGWIKAPTNGTYRFHMQPANAKVTVSRQSLGAGQSADGAPMEMTAGRFYPIVIEVDELASAKLPVRLEWTAPHGARYVVPRALLNLPTETVKAVPPR